MNGQKTLSKDQMAEDFIKRINPYEKHQPMNYDLRAYVNYIREHNLKIEEITPELVNLFDRNKK